MEKMNVKFQTLVMTTEWGELKDAIIKLYPMEEKNIDGYEHMYYELLSLERADSDMYIHIEEMNYPDDEEIFYNVHGRNGTVSEHDPDREETYAMEYTTWSEWLDMDVHYMTMEKHTNVDILAHCMHEMTFCGFDQETIKKNGDELRATLDERMQSIEDGTAKLISWDDLKKTLKEKFGFDEDRDDRDGEQRDGKA